MYCSKCGKEISPLTEICPNCGTREVTNPKPTAKPSRYNSYLPHFENEEGNFAIRDLKTGISTYLAAETALDLLDYCRRNEDWKTNGIPVTGLVYGLNPPKRLPEGTSSTEKYMEHKKRHRSTSVAQYLITGSDAELLFQTLTQNEEYLKDKRVEEQNYVNEVILQRLKLVNFRIQKEIANKVNLSGRPIQWTKQNEQTYRGEHNSFIGEVVLDNNSLLWSAQVKSPQGEFYQEESFAALPDALDWMEKTIEAAKDGPVLEPQPVKELPPPFELTDVYREKLAEYWIDPASIDPENVTYEVVIDLIHKPESFKTYTLSNGKQIQTDETYPSAATLAARTGLDSASLDWEDRDFGWYRITGFTHYNQSQQAISSAQSFWENSKILELFKEGAILKSRYGYRETETKYTEYVGECTQDGKTWLHHDNRDEYLKKLALRYTLIYALDLSGFRSLLQLTPDITDEFLLHNLQKYRAECKYIPSDIRADSLRWLRDKELEGKSTSQSQTKL